MGNVNRVAIMQPYLFPYIGYMNLVHASSEFVFYDDVNYINKGWINRNTIILNSRPYRFTVPLLNRSQNSLIFEVRVSPNVDYWKKFKIQLGHAYKKSKFFDQGMSYVEAVIDKESDRISTLAAFSIIEFFRIIGIERKFSFSSKVAPETRGMERSDRLIAITKLLKSDHYLGSIGGMGLYDKEYFSKKKVNLSFVSPNISKYHQGFENFFIPNLSIIDILMNVSVEEICSHVTRYNEI